MLPVLVPVAPTLHSLPRETLKMVVKFNILKFVFLSRFVFLFFFSSMVAACHFFSLAPDIAEIDIMFHPVLYATAPQ